MKYFVVLLLLVGSMSSLLADEFIPTTKKTVEHTITTEVIAPLTADEPTGGESGINIVRGTTRQVQEGIVFGVNGEAGKSIICTFTMPDAVGGVTLDAFWEANGVEITTLADQVVALPAEINFNVDEITAAVDATLGEVVIPVSFVYQYYNL